MDTETLILELGDKVLETRTEGKELSRIENLIYMTWVLDYAVRNAGSKEALEDFTDFDQKVFNDLCSEFEIAELAKVLDCKDDESFCDQYDKVFDVAVLTLNAKYK